MELSVQLVIVLLSAVGVCRSADTPLDRIKVRDQWMVDSYGRVRLFHGFNSVEKGPPWYESDILNATRLQLYKEWGFNAVRLGAMWKGVEPEPGKFDPSYLRTLQKIVEALEDNGLYAILDVHQDVFSIFNTSDQSIGYEGIPRWLVDKFPPSPHPFPWPFKTPPTGPNWALRYFTEAVSAGFQQLYNNTAGAMDYFTNFWTKVASTFREHSSVLGYELINEPWAGDIYHDSVLSPGLAGKKNLMPMYDRLNAAIRSVDDETLIFYEPVTWALIAKTGIFGTGFDAVPGGSSYQNRSVLSYHYYCWILSSNSSEHYSIAKKILCDDLLGPRVMKSMKSDVERIGGSSFLTEFGLCVPDGDPESINTVECNFVLSLADKNLQSWTYWDSKFFLDDDEINWNAVKPFARVYARAVAGTPLMMNFDLDNKSFHFEFLSDSSIKQPTEIFVPSIHFPSGIKVKTSAELQWKFDEKSRIVSVSPTGDSSRFMHAIVDITG